MYSFDIPCRKDINKDKSHSTKNIKTTFGYNVQQIQRNILPAHFYPVTPQFTDASPVIQRYIDKDAAESAIRDYEESKSTQSLTELNRILKSLGVIRGKIEYSGHDDVHKLFENEANMLPKLFDTFDILKASLIGRIENENEQQEKYIQSQVLFGNEFTFRKTDGSFNFDHIALAAESSDKNRNTDNNIINAGKIIQKWTDEVPKHYGDYRCTIKTGEQKWKSAPYQAWCVTYENKNPNESWYFNIDLDPNCIEIQTKPISYDKFSKLEGLIHAAIFRVAGKLGLVADTNANTGGGGHISFDVNTAFEGDAHYLRNFLVAYARESEANPLIFGCEDRENAPYLRDLGIVENFINAINDFDKLPTGQQEIQQLVDLIQQNVYKGKFCDNLKSNLRTKSPKGKLRATSLESAYHYQAVNLEHVNDSGGSRRVEMRRFNAQVSTGETIEQFKFLMRLLLESRSHQNLPLG